MFADRETSPRTERNVVVHARRGFDVVRVLTRRPEVPVTCWWRLNVGHRVELLVRFAMIQIGNEGPAAVNGQLSAVECNTIDCGTGHGVVGLQFVPTKGIGEALRGRALIGGTIYGFWVADMKESIAVVGNGYAIIGLGMWVRVEARTRLEMNTRPTVFEMFELALVPL